MSRGFLLLFIIGVYFPFAAQLLAANTPLAQQWVQRFHATARGDNAPNDMVLDNKDNVIVTGYVLSTNGPSDADFVTLKYSSSGVPLWTNYYDGPGHDWDQAMAVALDHSGKVFVTGISIGAASNYDYATIAYSKNGLPLWTNRYSSQTNDDNEAEAIAVDHTGAVYVSGFSVNQSFQYVTIKYSNTGVPIWTNYLTAAQDTIIDPRVFLAFGKNGAVLLSGTAMGATTGLDYVTVAYSSAGIPLWTNYFNGPGNQEDHLAGVATDKRGNVFVTGVSYANNTGYDFATIAYSAIGKPLWTNRLDGPADGSDFATAIAVDAKGDVFVAGDTPLVPGANPSYGIVAYSNAGIPLWTNFYTAATNDDQVADIATQANRSVFITGSSLASGTGFDYATVEYSVTGVPISTNRYNGPVNDTDAPIAIAVAVNGSVFVTGFSTGTNGGTDIATIKYAPMRRGH